MLALVLLLPGCQAFHFPSPGTANPGQPLIALAASDLQFALPEIVASYERETGRKVTVSFGSTGNLSQQIANGAPADVFFTADASFLADLEAQGLLVPGSSQSYAVGRLVLVSAPAAPVQLTTLEDLTRPEVRSIAVANPEHAPYGRAAQQALKSAGLWDILQPKLVLAEDISQTAQYVRSGNADAGLVALSVILGAPGTPYAIVDPSLYPPLRQVAAVLTASNEVAAARDFLNYVDGPSGRPTMIKYGFVLPGES
ncbi:MAG TPA: molybdate ABC transporter substrate-binding protein [Chloroflexota bacterium]